MKFKKPTLGYLAYPLTKPDYEKNMKEVIELKKKIMAKEPNLFLLTAHDSTQWSEDIEQYRSIFGDILIIQRAHVFVLGKPLDYTKSSGCVWETKIAYYFGKPIYTSDYLLGITPKPNLWKIKISWLFD